jgi:hypothetical protein
MQWSAGETLRMPVGGVMLSITMATRWRVPLKRREASTQPSGKTLAFREWLC